MSQPAWSGRRVLVTGAAGFIGSHCCERLLELGAQVVGLDNFDAFYGRQLKAANLGAVREAADRARVAHASARFDFIEGDLSDRAAIDRAVGGCTSVIHLAAKAGVRPSIQDPAGYTTANILGTVNVLEACSHGAGKGTVDRCVVASSSSVYGNASKVPFSELDSVESPISPYAATKRACELLGSTHHHLTGLPICMLRFFTVYGPRQRPDLAISKFLLSVARGEPIVMFGNGHTSRDYTFVSDVVAGTLAAHEATPRFGYRVWNLGSDRPTGLLELIGEIGRVVGRDAVITPGAPQPGDVERTWADLSRSAAELGYRASTLLRAGLERQWAWMRSQRPELAGAGVR